MSHRWVSLVLGAALLAVLSCGRADKDWRAATEANTVAGFETFLENHPKSAHAAEAKSRMDGLQVRLEFDDAIRRGSADDLERLLARYPDDPSVPRARQKLEEAWFNRAAAANTVASLSGYLTDHPSSPYAADARARLDAIYKEWMPPFRNARTIRVEIAESYGEAKKTQLPFRRVADEVLPTLGLTVVPAGEADVVLSIRANGDPTGENYSMFGIGGSFYYTGCDLSGSMTFRAGEARVTESFAHSIPPPYSFSTTMGGGPTGPDEAPFHRAFEECAPGAMRRLVLKAFGPGPLFAMLGAESDQTATAKALGRMQPPPLRRLLMVLSDDPRPAAKRMAAVALGETKSPQAIGPLLEAVRLDATLTSEASEALARIGAPAVPVLLTAVGDTNDRIATCAASALRSIGDERAVDPLIRRLNSPDDAVRATVIAALGDFGTPKAVAALKAAKAAGRQVPLIDSALADAATPDVE